MSNNNNNNKPQKLFHKYQKLYALIGIIYNIILIGLIIFAFIKCDEGFSIVPIVIGINGIYAVFDLITNIVFIVSKPFDQDISKSTLITSISDTLFHNVLATVSFVIVSVRKTSPPSTFWKISFCVVLIVLLRSLIMLASEVYWWIMLKNTIKNHTEDDFIIPEEELNTQYHQISYDYYNPKRLFNQSNVVILNKKQKKKINELQQEELILQELERDDTLLSSSSSSQKKLDRQEQNKAMISDYIKERMANDSESNYQYIRQKKQQHQNLYFSSSSHEANLLHDTLQNDSDSDSDSDSKSDSDSHSDGDKDKNRDISNEYPSKKGKGEQHLSDPIVVEMYNPSNVDRRISISSTSSSSSSVQPSQSFGSKLRKKSDNENYTSEISIEVQDQTLNSFTLNPEINIDSEIGSIKAPLSVQKTKVLEYIDKLIEENKEKKRAKRQAQQENPEKYDRSHPQEWFSKVMGVKEIQEEKDAKLFVQAKQKKEKECQLLMKLQNIIILNIQLQFMILQDLKMKILLKLF